MLKFHDTFRKAKSLDEMIQLHDDQYAFSAPFSSALILTFGAVSRKYVVVVSYSPMYGHFAFIKDDELIRHLDVGLTSSHPLDSRHVFTFQ